MILEPGLDIACYNLRRDAGLRPDDLAQERTAAVKVDASLPGVNFRGAGPRFVMAEGHQLATLIGRRIVGEVLDTKGFHLVVRLGEGAILPGSIAIDLRIPDLDGSQRGFLCV